MSRETDSSSPGPQGRGGAAAYPSGTPPYGTGQYPSPQPWEEPRGSANGERAKETADEPKTETTLTTRIRINIPGSRPIPPVVVRKPVAGAEGGDAAAAETGGGGSTRETPSWPAPQGAAASASAQVPGAPAAPADGGPRGGPAKTGADKPASDWFAPRKPPAAAPPPGQPPAAAGTPGAPPPTARPNIPYLGGSDQVPPARAAGGEAPFGGPAPAGAPPFAAGPAVGDQLFGSGAALGAESRPGPFPGPAAPEADRWPELPQPGSPQAGPPQPEQPTGLTTGPVTGGAQLPGAPTGPRLPGSGDGQAPAGYRPPSGGASPFGAGPLGGPAAGAPGAAAGVPSGIPAMPSAEETAAAQPAAPAPAKPGAAAPARKRRSKLVLAGIGLFSAAAVVYGAGLLMDHSDVPNGTVVMGTDIGGTTRDQALRALDAAAGTRGTAPLRLRIGDRTVQLLPDVAGLGIDTQSTVGEVAHADYDPISVISALFGGKHQVVPAVTVDQEKLRNQLQGLSSDASMGSDGMVKFVDGKPVAVPGRPYQTLNVDASMQLITNAYLKRAETGQDLPVALAVQTHQPKVTQAAIDNAVKEIGDPAMSGKITVVAGTKSVLFSPQRSLSKILTLVPDSQGQLVLHFDLGVLKDLYGNAFDGVLLQRGDGSKTPVTPYDVASAMMPELRKTAAVKTAVIPNVAK